MLSSLSKHGPKSKLNLSVLTEIRLRARVVVVGEHGIVSAHRLNHYGLSIVVRVIVLFILLRVVGQRVARQQHSSLVGFLDLSIAAHMIFFVATFLFVENTRFGIQNANCHFRMGPWRQSLVLQGSLDCLGSLITF